MIAVFIFDIYSFSVLNYPFFEHGVIV